MKLLKKIRLLLLMLSELVQDREGPSAKRASRHLSLPVDHDRGENGAQVRQDPIVVPAPLATASAAAQAIVQRSLEPIGRFLPGVGDAIDDARRTAERTLGSASGSSGSSLWMPGVDVTCQNFLAQERIARALSSEPGDLDVVAD